MMRTFTIPKKDQKYSLYIQELNVLRPDILTKIRFQSWL